MDAARRDWRDRRCAQRHRGARIAPRIVGFVGAAVAFGVERAGVGGVPLQRVAAGMARPKASASTGSGAWSFGVYSP